MSDVQLGYSHHRVTIEGLDNSASWRGLDPEFRRRLAAMFVASGYRIGLGQGFRNPVAGRAEYLRREAAKARGEHPAPMTPPERSWHSSIPAHGADLVFDDPAAQRWAHEHGHEFGLRDFTDVNREPWHFAPIETPTRRTTNLAPPKLPVLAPGTAPTLPEYKPPTAPKSFPPFDPEHGLLSLWPFAQNKPTLHRGAGDRDAIRYLQAVLVHGCEMHLTIDGHFGHSTEEAVLHLQSFFGLTPDGVVGPQTWAAVDLAAANVTP